MTGLFMPALSNRLLLIFGIIVSFLTALMAITGESLWIDEFGTWLITRAVSLPAWWLQLKSWPDSDSQIPLYHLYMYAWTHLFGTDAWMMRLSNLPLFVLAIFILILPFRASRSLAVALILTSCLNAFLWYYLNELRPYIFIYLGVAMLYTSTLELLKTETDNNRARGAIALWSTGMLVSCGASVLGVPWTGACLLLILVYWRFIQKRKLWSFIKANALILTVACIAVILLLVHHVQMFFSNGRATQLFETNLLTVLFSAYSVTGLLGVGPGMLAMRKHGITALMPYFPAVTISAIVLLFLAVGGLLALQRRLGNKTILLVFACALLPVMFTLLMGYVLHWRVVGRHLMPVLPLLNILYAFGFVRWYEKSHLGKTITLAAVLILSYSALSIRYAHRHVKDDYLHASILAKEELAEGEEVWWVADHRGARYYGVPYSIYGEQWPDASQPHMPEFCAMPKQKTSPPP